MTITRPRRAWLGRALLLTVVALVATSCQGTWGLRTSYRNYVTAPFASGGITVADGAGWQDGTGTGKGPFTWPIAWATYDQGTGTGEVQFGGTIRTYAHPSNGDYVLELTIGSPRLEIDGDTGILVADLTYRPYQGMGSTVPPLQSAVDVEFATLDLSGTSWTPDANGAYQILGAPMTGIPAAMELIGWDDFYGNPVALDPLTVTFNPSTFAPKVGTTPKVVVSKTDNLKVGDQVVVWGEGFDPSLNPGTRPPFSGLPSGNYVVFGRFQDVWKPSLGTAQAPTSSRHVIDQRWAVPPATRHTQDPNETNASYVNIDATGRWKAVLTVGAGTATSGNYGVYTYPGSGATNAAHEFAVPVTVGFTPPA